jgi:succinoglycan biosynthesis protein ExoM
MLAKCLQSLAGAAPPQGAGVEIVVVDNTEEGGARNGALSFASSSPYPIHYVCEPRRGISYARNASVEKALSLGADWLAFLDDDEWVQEDWLLALTDAAARYSADVVCGPVKPVYPEKPPFWTVVEDFRAGSLPPEGLRMQSAATCNTLAAAKLFAPAPAGLGLRFGEALGLSGGEDAELFNRAVRAGASVFFTAKAMTFETVPPSRLTYRRAVECAYRRGTTYRQELAARGQDMLLARAVRKAASRLLSGVFLAAILPFHIPFGARRFKFAAVRMGRNFAYAAGIAANFMGRKSNYYLRIDGY